MKELNITEKSQPASSQDLDLFESEYNIKLPTIYRNFLEVYNPISTLESLFIISEDEFWINDFYPFDKDYQDSIQSVQSEIGHLFNNKYIPFASDAGGWHFLISVNEVDYGKVYFCRMDEELENGLTLLADDFEEFIDGLE